MEGLEFMGHGDVKLAADAFGPQDAPVVVLLPSGGQTKEFWHGTAKALADAGRYAICLDLRGHGDSGQSADGRYDLGSHVADLRGVLATIPSRAVVVGAGLGGLIALVTAGESVPHLMAGVALVDVNIWFDEQKLVRLHNALLTRTTEVTVAVQLADAVARANPEEPALADMTRLMGSFADHGDGHLAWRGDPRALQSTDLLEQLDRLGDAASKIATPVILLRGALNATISNEDMLRLQSVIPGAEIAEIAGAGHLLSADRDDLFDAVLLDFIERTAPRKPLHYIGGSEPRVLRDALGCFATGVTIVTTLDKAGDPVGLTANSFTSVSLDPPLVLFALGNGSGSLEIFKTTGHFAVNVLHIGQQPLSNRFASRNPARFEGIDWTIRSENGSPILPGTLASFDCRTYAVHEGGDHTMFVGEVNHAWFEPHRDPLLYFRGKYQRLHFS